MRRIIGSCVLFAMAAVAAPAAAQQPGGFDPMGMAKRALAEPFVGLTTDGAPSDGIFSLAETGVSTEPVAAAARAFIESFSEAEAARLRFPVEDDAWRNWANIHKFPREGVSLKEMTNAQREGAFALLRASLSAKGYRTSRDIMRLNHHLAELVDDFEDYGEGLYWFVVFGEPSTAEPWGWQIEGHHLIINYFVRGDQVVMTPTFMGSEPVEALSGKYAGTRILEDEQAAALDFVNALPGELRQVAVIGEKTGRSENIAEMFKDNVTTPYSGVAGERLAPALQERLIDLIRLFVDNLRDGHAGVKLEEVRSHIDRTWFAWIGPTDPDAVFYFRIHSPVIFIEFDHQGPIALDGPRGAPTRRHIHTVVRTPNGGDYGKDLLRRHYEAAKDDHGHKH